MKRLYFILGLILSLLLFSCEKEQDPIPPKDCKCGTMTSYGAYYTDTFKIKVTYWIDLRNNCTQNKKRLAFSGYDGIVPKEWKEIKDSGKWCGTKSW